MERHSEDDKDFEDAADRGAELGINSIEQVQKIMSIHLGDHKLHKKIADRLNDLNDAITDRCNNGHKIR